MVWVNPDACYWPGATCRGVYRTLWSPEHSGGSVIPHTEFKYDRLPVRACVALSSFHCYQAVGVLLAFKRCLHLKNLKDYYYLLIKPERVNYNEELVGIDNSEINISCRYF